MGQVGSGASVPAAPGGLTEAFRRERPYLVAMAAAMLHDEGEAEDVVHEAARRLVHRDAEDVVDPRGWSMVLVRRLALTRLAGAQRPEAAAGWLGDHRTLPGDHADPAIRIPLDGEAQLAKALLLDELRADERSAFVLHDVFRYSDDAVGELVGRAAAAGRALVERARQVITTAPTPSGSAASREARRPELVAERFVAACAGGEVAELSEVLDPEVVAVAVIEGRGPLPAVEGRAAVAARILQLFGPGTAPVLVPITLGESAAIVTVRDRTSPVVFRLDDRGGLVHHVHGFVRRRPRRTD